MVTFLASGLWHGASWSFVVWGGLHGLYQIIGYELRGVKDRINEQLHTKTDCLSYKLGQVLVTFCLTDFAWIFFRANSLGDAFAISAGCSPGRISGACLTASFIIWALTGWK